MMRWPALVMLTGLGCHGGVGHTSLEGMAYPYAPTSVKIHSLSRLTRDSAGAVDGAELWVEFKDMDGQTSRATGSVTATAVAGSGAPVGRTISLDDATANFEAWDTALRMYRIKLQFDKALDRAPPGGIGAEVVWRTPTLKVVKVTARVREPG